MGELVKAKRGFRMPQRSFAQKKGLPANSACHQEALSASYFPCPPKKGTLLHEDKHWFRDLTEPAYVMTSRNNFHQQEYKWFFSALISSVFRILWHIQRAAVEVAPGRLLSPSLLTNSHESVSPRWGLGVSFPISIWPIGLWCRWYVGPSLTHIVLRIPTNPESTRKMWFS